MQAVGLADWQTAAERLTALAADVPGEPVIWRNLATLRGWLADNAGCIEALHKYAALRTAQADGLEDAVEAEAEAMFLADDPLGDRLEIFKLVWTVKDVERAQEAFLSAPRLRPIPFNPAEFGDAENPPPKAAYLLLDRPMPESAEGLSVENTPRLLGQVLLFGRQTDREARLELHGRGGRRAIGRDRTDRRSGRRRRRAGRRSAAMQKEVVGHWSASQKLLRAAWQPPRDASPEQLRQLSEAVWTPGNPRAVAGAEARHFRWPLAAAGRRRRSLSRPSAGGHHGAGALVAAIAGAHRLQPIARRAGLADPRTDRSAATSRGRPADRCGWGG